MKEYKYKINGKEYSVVISSVEGNIANVNVNGRDYTVEMENTPAPIINQLATASQILASAPIQSNVATPEPAPQVSVAGSASQGNAAGKEVKAPLPGVILDVCVKEGQVVKAGEKLVILEAMKMENEIQAEVSGTVTKIHVNKGDTVMEGAPVVTIA